MTDEEVLRWYECERKQRRFMTFTEANDHAWQVEQSQVGDWHGVHAYECTHCGGFHIGRAQLGRRRGMGRRLEHARHYEKKHPEPVRSRVSERSERPFWRQDGDSMSENTPEQTPENETTEAPATASPGGTQPVGTKVETTVTEADNGAEGDEK